MVRLSWLAVKNGRLAWQAARNMSTQDASGCCSRLPSLCTMDASRSGSTDWPRAAGDGAAAQATLRGSGALERRCCAGGELPGGAGGAKLRVQAAALAGTGQGAAVLADHRYSEWFAIAIL
jgi:hypothetical protein